MSASVVPHALVRAASRLFSTPVSGIFRKLKRRDESRHSKSAYATINLLRYNSPLKNFAVLLALSFTALAQPYDSVIYNGRIIDGTGSPWHSGDIAIKDGRIAAIGKLAPSAGRQSIDANGMVVAPGFIDMLGQSELTILVNPHLPTKIFQRITTEITEEGKSIAALTDAIVPAQRSTS